MTMNSQESHTNSLFFSRNVRLKGNKIYIDDFVDFARAKTRAKSGKRRRKPKPKYDGVRCLELKKLQKMSKKHCLENCNNEWTVGDLYEVALNNIICFKIFKLIFSIGIILPDSNWRKMLTFQELRSLKVPFYLYTFRTPTWRCFLLI